MSEVVRNYSRKSPYGYTRSRRRKQRRTRLFAVCIVLAVLGAVWAGWTTRDTCEMGALIPKDDAYQVFVPDLLEKRSHMAESAVWDLLPEAHPLREFRTQLENNFGLPEWMVNNGLQGLVHLSGNQLSGFGDVLVATRITRIGALAEQFRSLFPGLHREEAGGLRIYRIEPANLFYARRGRILLLSPSRESVVRALTLTDDEAVGEAALQDEAARIGGNDLLWAFRFTGENHTAWGFSEGSLALQWRPQALRMTWDGVLAPEWRTRFAPLLENAAPSELQAPAPGPIALSANLGKPLPTLWEGLAAATGQTPAFESLRLWAVSFFAQDDAWIGFAQALAGQMGPAFTLSWCGIDANEMLPAPEFSARFDTDAAHIGELLAALPPAPEGLSPEDPTPRWNPETGLLSIPAVGGPSIEPCFALQDGQVLFSTSRTVAETELASPAPRQTLPQQGNLYVRAVPHQGLSLLMDAARPFVEMGFVRGHTLESFEAMVEPWFEYAAKIHDVSAYAAQKEGALEIRVEVEMASESASGKEQPVPNS